MKRILPILALGVAIASLAFSAYLSREVRKGSSVGESAATDSTRQEAAETVVELQGQINDLSADLYELRQSVGAVPRGPDAPEEAGDAAEQAVSTIRDRIATLEKSVASLQNNYAGLSIDGASEERAKVFASSDGAIKADEYFEAGKYSIAAEGYLTYYRNHPDQADSKGVLERARRSYLRAGYSDMALWTQEEIMRLFPENQPRELATLAEMEKDAGLYDEAIEHVTEAAELMPENQSRLWTRMYWAWYNHLRDGNEAGLVAYEEVQQEIDAAGYSEEKLGQKVQEKIDAIVRQMRASQARAKAAK
jgi:tetratricopeptide (TPR) repeat protein